ERWLLGRMSESVQIESLWRFNEKYDPDWRPRYAVFESTEDLAVAALAVARAEGVTELPLVGRFLRPTERAPLRQGR
ncbi:MAG: lysyl-tRNA synthetase, class, partial [Actinomycetota bacterium]|nr:lysyl-tRNA synthetase, class [Actinomycetota bacterium]